MNFEFSTPQPILYLFIFHEIHPAYLLIYSKYRFLVSVQIVDPTISVTGVTLNKSSLNLEVDQSEVLTATVSPANATNKVVTWFTSNAAVATVLNGQVSAIKAGSDTITVYVDENQNAQLDSNEKKASATISVTEKTKPSEPVGDPIPASGESLLIGNTTVSGPTNTTPVDINDWVYYDFSSSLPSYWSFITGNNKKTTSNDFYAPSSGGGFKFSQLYYGLQSPLLNSWLKTEVRLKVSQVNNNSQPQNKYEGKPIFHIYSYDETGHYIGMQTYNKQNKFADITTISFYIVNPDMAYFEIRLNAFPYKGSQCYNFGISQISLNGWPYPL